MGKKPDKFKKENNRSRRMTSHPINKKGDWRGGVLWRGVPRGVNLVISNRLSSIKKGKVQRNTGTETSNVA